MGWRRLRALVPGVDLPIAQTFSTGAASAIVLGEDAAGASHVFTLTPSGAASVAPEVAFKVARNHARGLRRVALATEQQRLELHLELEPAPLPGA